MKCWVSAFNAQSYAFDGPLCQNWLFSPPNYVTLQITLLSSKKFPHQNGWAFHFWNTPPSFSLLFLWCPLEKWKKQSFASALYQVTPRSLRITLLLLHTCSECNEHTSCNHCCDLHSHAAGHDMNKYRRISNLILEQLFYMMTNCFSLSLSDQKVLLNTIWAGDKTPQNL